jgi:Protein of Unknown function (DUF2784)
MLWARVLADLVVVLHAGLVGFITLGMAAILIGLALGRSWVRNFWFRATHLAAIVLVAAVSLAGTRCPLTVWENALRRQAGQATYPGAFLGYWVHRLIFFEAPDWAFTLGYTLFGLAVLAAFLLAPPRWPRPTATPSASAATGH